VTTISVYDINYCAVVNLEENNFSISAKFTNVYCNRSGNYPRISGKMSFTIEEKAILLECYFRNRVKQENGN
jgi:hypothetical protein